jgi:hypothetical protein
MDEAYLRTNQIVAFMRDRQPQFHKEAVHLIGDPRATRVVADDGDEMPEEIVNPFDESESEKEEEEVRVVSIRDSTVQQQQQQQPTTSIAEKMVELASEFPVYAIDNLTVRPKEIFERGAQATTMPERRSENAEQAFEKMNTEEYQQQRKYKIIHFWFIAQCNFAIFS